MDYIKRNYSSLLALADALIYKGVIDCSANPNYPAADAGHVYKVSVAGKIGGDSGTVVTTGDTLICSVDGTATGTQAAVGANWNIIQGNLDIESATAENDMLFGGTSPFGWLKKTLAQGKTVLFGTSTDLQENAPILQDASLSADGKYTAISSEAGVLGETVAFGEAVYFKAADSKWWKAKADVAATSGPVRIGLCVVVGDADDATIIVFIGTIRADALFDTFTISAPVFLSAATAGKIASAAPTGTTNFVVRTVGHAVDGNTVHVNVSQDYIELA
uniref:Uncharacterized protein n=1 Tax=viral metagenome TaxID=1070528 RepID=A0A6M3J489_9ZZZZ